VLSDTKPNTTLSLAPGVIFVSFQTNGASEMDVGLSAASKEYGAADVFTTNGPFNGSLAYEIPVRDQYLLDITGTGVWTAVVGTENPTASWKVPMNMSGSGTMVTPFFTLEKGQYIFLRSEIGSASPQYYLRYANGSFVMDANNTFSEPRFGEISQSPFRFINVPATGTYFVSTLTDNNPGSWHASILPIPIIPHMGPGPVITQ
jgi:hypothetical protein